MSKSLKLAAVAAALVVGSTSVYAASGNLTAEVLKIIQRELAKVVPGPTGPMGPAGMNGLPSLFARVSFNGFVDPSKSSGISQENFEVHKGKIGPPGARVRNNHYCFVGLPPVMGGQVTIDGFGFPTNLAAPTIEVDTGDPGCPIRVSVPSVKSGGVDRVDANFYILLY